MKKVLLIVVVAALALTLVPLAIAGAAGGGGWKHGKAKFNLVGTVTAVSAADTTVDPAAASTITIKVKAGTKTVRAFRGAEAHDDRGRRRQDPAAHRGRGRRHHARRPGARGRQGQGARHHRPFSCQGAPPVFIIKDLKVKAPPAEPTTPPPAE